MSKREPFTLDMLIAFLEQAYKEHGDMPLLYAVDDEGNGHRPVMQMPSVCTVKKSMKYGERFWDWQGITMQPDAKSYRSLKTRQYGVIIN